MGTLAALTLPAYNQTFDLMAWFLGPFCAHAGRLRRLQPGRAADRGTHHDAGNLLRRDDPCRCSRTGACARVRVSAPSVSSTRPYAGRHRRRAAGDSPADAAHRVKGVILAGAAIHLCLGGIAGPGGPAPARGARRCGDGRFCGSVRLRRVRRQTRSAADDLGVYRTGSATLPEGVAVDYLRDGKTATISLVDRAGRVTIAPMASPTPVFRWGRGSHRPMR